MIIDAHVHITKDGKWFDTGNDASLKKLIVSLDENKIDRAILLPIFPYISNEYILNVCNEYPEKFIGFCSVNPLKRDAVNDLEHYVVDYGLKGLKLHPKIQGFFSYDNSINNVIIKATDLKIPVLIDAWIKQDEINSSKIINLIETIAQKHPSCKIILPHLGGYSYKKMPEISKKFSNISFDLSFVLSKFDGNVLQNEIIPIIQKIGSRKLIFGSDFPEIDITQYLKRSSQVFTDMHYSSRDFDAVFSKNIRNLLQ